MDGCLLWTVCLFVFCIFFAVLFAGRLRPARSSRKFKPTREGGCLDETWAGVTSLSQLGANRKTPSSTIAGATVTDIGGRWVLSGTWLKWTLWHSFPMQYGWWTTLLKNGTFCHYFWDSMLFHQSINQALFTLATIADFSKSKGIWVATL